MNEAEYEAWLKRRSEVRSGFRPDVINEVYKLVWAMRQRNSDVWPTPDVVDSVRFAVTEASEALDAWLRESGVYARNNDKQSSVNEELGDCAMMLVTALGVRYREQRGYMLVLREYSVDDVVVGVAKVLEVVNKGGVDDIVLQRYMLDVLNMIVYIVGVNKIEVVVRKRLERIEEKCVERRLRAEREWEDV